MNGRRFGRTRQTWVLMIVCIVLFGIFLRFIGAMTLALWWRVMLAAIVASGICVGLFQLWLRSLFQRRDSAIHLLNRITAGDLSLGANEIRTAAQSNRMADALRALVSNLERTIRRFGQLATDVSTVSNQISGRLRILGRTAATHLPSTQTTSRLVRKINRSVNNLRNRVA